MRSFEGPDVVLGDGELGVLVKTESEVAEEAHEGVETLLAELALAPVLDQAVHAQELVAAAPLGAFAVDNRGLVPVVRVVVRGQGGVGGGAAQEHTLAPAAALLSAAVGVVDGGVDGALVPSEVAASGKGLVAAGGVAGVGALVGVGEGVGLELGVVVEGLAAEVAHDVLSVGGGAGGGPCFGGGGVGARAGAGGRAGGRAGRHGEPVGRVCVGEVQAVLGAAAGGVRVAGELGEQGRDGAQDVGGELGGRARGGLGDGGPVLGVDSDAQAVQRLRRGVGRAGQRPRVSAAVAAAVVVVAVGEGAWRRGQGEVRGVGAAAVADGEVRRVDGEEEVLVRVGGRHGVGGRHRVDGAGVVAVAGEVREGQRGDVDHRGVDLRVGLRLRPVQRLRGRVGEVGEGVDEVVVVHRGRLEVGCVDRQARRLFVGGCFGCRGSAVDAGGRGEAQTRRDACAGVQWGVADDAVVRVPRGPGGPGGRRLARVVVAAVAGGHAVWRNAGCVARDLHRLCKHLSLCVRAPCYLSSASCRGCASDEALAAPLATLRARSEIVGGPARGAERLSPTLSPTRRSTAVR